MALLRLGFLGRLELVTIPAASIGGAIVWALLGALIPELRAGGATFHLAASAVVVIFASFSIPAFAPVLLEGEGLSPFFERRGRVLITLDIAASTTLIAFLWLAVLGTCRASTGPRQR